MTAPHPSRGPTRFALFLALIAIAPVAAHAVIPGFTWEDAEVVRLGVPEIPSSSGAAAAYTPGWSPWSELQWHVVYALDDEIYRQIRDEEGGWQPPEPLTNDPAASRDPKLAFHDQWLHVVYEDDRTGHAEVYTRRWNGDAWSAEECVTCDDIPSSKPVIAGSHIGAMLVWENDSMETRSVKGAYWDDGIPGWGPAIDVSESPADAFDPSVAAMSYNMKVVWTDTRHGDPEIYLRSLNDSGYMGDETRVTDMTGSCGHADVHVESCCGDNIDDHALVCFENDQSGVPEVWTACVASNFQTTPAILSADDGVASMRPNVNGFAFWQSFDGFGGVYGRWFVTWTDAVPVAGAANTHPIAFFAGCDDPSDGADVITDGGLATSSLGGIGAVGPGPEGEILAVWIEESEGQPALHSRRGNMLACVEPEYGGPAALIVAPEGVPTNTLTATTLCGGGGPLEGDIEIDLSFVDGDITWDENQEHPLITEAIDENGDAVFSIRGGGCAEGTVIARHFGVTVFVWPGVTSPDIDGDCVVTFEDVLYVTTQTGTDDFCADLDGSGLVDGDDLAIVEAAMGDHCNQVTGVGDTDAAPRPFAVSIAPNPVTSRGIISFSAPAAGRVTARVVDASGRLVRELGSFESATPSGVVPWDARDDAGRRLSSGVYFVVLETKGTTVSRPFLVLH